MDSHPSSRPAKRSSAGFFSSTATFFLPMGEHFDAGPVRGYYIDMRTKASSATMPPIGAYHLHVASIQWGLGCFERYLAGDGELWLNASRECADALIHCQHKEGRQAGAFVHTHPLRHTFALRPAWISAMAQGEGASLLVRIFQETGKELYADAARRALLPLAVHSTEGGAHAILDGRWFPEEYPTQPPSYVLNGAIFTLWGLRDVGVALGDASALARFEDALATLSMNLHRWDLGYWSRYDLFPHPVSNVASSFYHALHIDQLRAMNRLAPTPELVATTERWQRYRGSLLCRQRAFAGKALFRMLVPRTPWLARRLPWSRLGTDATSCEPSTTSAEARSGHDAAGD